MPKSNRSQKKSKNPMPDYTQGSAEGDRRTIEKALKNQRSNKKSKR